MAFVPNFQVGQNILYPNIVVASDLSTGSDVLIISRRIYVSDSQGNFLVPSGISTQYTPWPLADASISLNILTEDTAVSILVQWLSVTNTVLYSLTQQFCLAEYNQQFGYYLTQQLGLPNRPPLSSDSSFVQNYCALWGYITGAINAITINNDLAGSQNILNQATYLRLNQANFF